MYMYEHREFIYWSTVSATTQNAIALKKNKQPLAQLKHLKITFRLFPLMLVFLFYQ